MHEPRILMAIIAAGLITSLTDWLFMGVLFHKKYLAYPEVWRIKPGQPDARLIFWSQVVGLVSCAAFILVCARLGFHTWAATMKLAAMGWAMGPLPILVQNLMWTKVHHLITVAHLLGWLVRLAVCGVAFMLLLG